MKLKKLQLENFRNYKALSFEFPQEKNILILVGLNGKGKTNFLEAIYALSIGRSFRTLINEHLVNWDADYLRIKGEIVQDGEEEVLEVFFSKRPRRQKNFRKNGVNQKNSEYIGNLITVLFHPEDLNMLYLSPSYRRQYLDTLLSQTDKQYLFALTQYRKILKQRNALLSEILKNKLRGGKDTKTLEEDLDTWDLQMADYGTQIIKKRQALVEFISQKIEEIYRQISGLNEEIQIKYSTKFREDFLYELKERRDKDVYRAKTGMGPHLDDLSFYINSLEIDSMASRGEFRTLLLSLKLVEIEFIKEKTSQIPLLLLDDVFSELDEERQKHLTSIIRIHQTIITTTHLENVMDISDISEVIGIEKLG
ncbi:DNA replication/repair protein RecF [Candidatus Peregrinibacteria bacterium CG10_big_fil_rev_8_21_14_0_10_36_19]|nr:MAG: DNA replication/repair protein RecF [Candidatus Peregrinibacteria bacterium CG10_big_fil_rev_8_21_14_0_10_36_19]